MFLVATAGHVDHGKTALIRALTGTETDRLPQEKARGISIDLGFAYWTDGPQVIGFVDVPGHERFIATMLAGAGAVNFALLVIAADDGIMPQTREHLDILSLLGVRRGVAVISKADLGGNDQIQALSQETAAMLEDTPLAGIPILPVSATTGRGVAELSQLLRSAAVAARTDREAGFGFRLAIDKAFTVPGAGTVVSGAVRDGGVMAGDRLLLQPSGIEVTVRGIQAAGRAVAKAAAGDRCALNLRGVSLDQVRRGDWLVAPGCCRPSQRLTVDLCALASAKGLAHNSQLHLHVGTTDMPCRLLLGRRSQLAPGESGTGYLVTARPVLAVAGDAFVLRDAPGRQTLGGGRVVDPFAPYRPRQDQEPLWNALRNPLPEAGFRDLVAHTGTEVDSALFAQRRNLSPERAESMLSDPSVIRLGHAALSPSSVSQVEQALLAGVDAFHAARPSLVGRPVSEALADLPFSWSRHTRRAILRRLRDREQLVLRGGFVHRPDHVPERPASSEAEWHRILDAASVFEGASFSPRDLADASNIPETEVAQHLFDHRGQSAIWRISPTRFMLDTTLRGIADEALALTPTTRSGFDVAALRDCTRVGRNLLIEVLEFFDRTGITHRRKDRRRAVADLDAAFQRAAQAEATMTRNFFLPPPRRRGPQPR